MTTAHCAATWPCKRLSSVFARRWCRPLHALEDRDKRAEASLKFRPDLVPVRKRILQCLRERDADAAQRGMTHCFDEMRRGAPAGSANSAIHLPR